MYPAGTVTPSDKDRGKGHGLRRVNSTKSDFSTPWQDAQTPMTYRRESGEEVGDGDEAGDHEVVDKSYVNPVSPPADADDETPRKPVPKSAPAKVIPTLAKGNNEKDSLYWKLPSPNGYFLISCF